MYQYKYIPVDTGGGFCQTREHRELIDTHTPQKAGRYVGFFPVSFTSHGGLAGWT